MYTTRLIKRKSSRGRSTQCLFSSDSLLTDVSIALWIDCRVQAKQIYFCVKKNRSTVSLTYYVIYLPYSTFFVALFVDIYADSFRIPPISGSFGLRTYTLCVRSILFYSQSIELCFMASF